MGSAESERWRRIARLFDEAVSLSGEERRTLLDRASAEDPELRLRVAELLSSSDRATGFPERPSHDAADPVPAGVVGEARDGAGRPSTLANETIGPYRLLVKIGEGGMGEVWRAEQVAPLRRQVALKVIKSGMDTKEVVARFDAERQAIAWMDHPAIARVYDAGETPRGLPYFAMELVAGDPITSYCDRQRLSVRERLGLFLQVCEGVQHAHQKAIIHRDLKPSNILVSIQNGKAVPKIIDFGIAKATSGRLTEETLYTGLGTMIGTPEYMSPEQVEMTPLGLDTRADVYALGVLLYELLTGTLPFDFRELREGAHEEIRRRIREVEPKRPSSCVKVLDERSAEVARNRRTEAVRLVSRLQGELDWIVLRALEKDRTRRYGSAAELAADLERHLRDEPVAAGPPGVVYRARKFVRRNRLGAAIAAAILIGLVAVAVVASVQARRIAKERDRADREAEASSRVTDFLVELFRVSDPEVAQGKSLSARELLDRGAASIKSDLGTEPLVQARLMLTMGNAYMNLGLYEEAESHLRDSVEQRRRLLGEEDPDTLASMHMLAENLWLEGRFTEAEALARKTLDLRRRVLGEADPATLASANLLGTIQVESGNPRAAAAELGQSLGTRRGAPGIDDREGAKSLKTVANANLMLGRYPIAESQFREALEQQLQLYRHENLETLEDRNLLALTCFLQGKYAEAEALYREGLEASKRLYGPDHLTTLELQAGVGASKFLEGSREEGEAIYRRSLEARLKLYGEDNPFTQQQVFGVGMMSLFEHRYTEAEAAFRQASDGFRRLTGPDRYNTLWALDGLAVAALHNGKPAEAENILVQVVDTSRRVLGADHPHTRDSMRHLAEVYADQGRYADAERLYTEALAGTSSDTWQDPRVQAGALFGLAGIEARRGEHAQAMDHLRRAVELGFDGARALARNPDLESLRADPAFRKLAAAVEKNSLRPPVSPTP